MIDLNFPNAVTQEVDFYGRRRELALIEQALDKRVPVVILGERRIGKTSLQNIAIERLKANTDKQQLFLKVEPRGLDTLEEFVKSILQRLALETKTDLDQTGLVDPSGDFHLEVVAQFDRAFASLITPGNGVTYVLCVDEFDELLRIEEKEVTRIDALIHHLTGESNLPLALLFTMTRLPESIQVSVPTPFTSIAQIVELEPLSRPEMEELVSGLLQNRVDIPPEGMDWLFQMSAGHPYFTKLLLANLLEPQPVIEPGLVITANMWDQALENAVGDTRANHALENIYRVQFSDAEKRVLLLLANQERTISSEELKEIGPSYLTAARKLVQRDYLAEQEGAYSFRIAFLGYWLREWIEFEEELDRLKVGRMLDPWVDSYPTTVTDEDMRRYGLDNDY